MFSSSSSSSPLPSSAMDLAFPWHGRSYSTSPSSQTPPPSPTSSDQAPHWLPHSGGGRAPPLRSPYYTETLESSIASLSLSDYAPQALTPPPPLYNPQAAAAGPTPWLKDPLPDAYPESSDFDVSRSAFHPNLLLPPPNPLDQDYLYHYNSSSAVDRFRNHPIPADYALLAEELLARRLLEPPCTLADCSCQYAPSALNQFLIQRRHHHHHHHQMARHKSPAYTPVCASPSPSASASTSNRRNSSRPCVDLDLSSIDLKSLRGSVVACAQDQNGCRILQAKLQDPTEEEIEMVLSESVDHVPQLMVHSFGNYFVQKLIEVCNVDQRARLLDSVIKDSRQLISICRDNHGTRAVQKLLEKLSSSYQIFRLMYALRPGVVDLIKDMNGHHVIQHCLKNFSAQQNEFLLHEVSAHCFDIATDKSGCCVLQQCVDNSEGEVRERLLYYIIADALQLAEDRYGNYVVQHVLEMNDYKLGAKIVNQLQGSFVQLSCNKFASHVLEKCLLNTDITQASLIILELVKSPKVPELLVDQYGNFVYQAALKASLKDSQRLLYGALRRLVQANVSSMRNNMYGRKILEWFERNGDSVV